jgi:hypothetical protein
VQEDSGSSSLESPALDKLDLTKESFFAEHDSKNEI